MAKKKWQRGVRIMFMLIVISVLPCLSFLEPQFFLNVTGSMPKGIYLKKIVSVLNIGGIIVFNLNSKKGNLIKYIAGREGDEFCFDFTGALWINGFPVAQKNIDKYPEQTLTQSECKILKKGELLVLGDHPDSYDSRYFGPIDISGVIAQARLIYGIGPLTKMKFLEAR